MSETSDTPVAPTPGPSPDAVAQPTAAPPTAALDKKKSIILGVIGLIFIVFIFVRVIPQVTGSGYAKAFAELAELPARAPTLLCCDTEGELARARELLAEHAPSASVARVRRT